MAQRIIRTLVDDIDGSEAAGTVRFSYLGVEYELDLSAENNAAFHAAMDPWVRAARKRKQVKGTKQSSPHRRKSAEIRAWAKQRGIKVNERGRIPDDVVAAYMGAERA